MGQSLLAPVFFLMGGWILFIGWYAGGTSGLLFPGAIGWIMWLVALLLRLRNWQLGRRLQHLRRHGVAVVAIPAEVLVNYGTRVNGMNPWRLKCQGVAPTKFAGREFVTPNLWCNPGRLMATGSAIRVYADPLHPRRYAFDLGELGLDAQPPGARRLPIVFGGIGALFTLVAAGMLLVRYGGQYLPESWQVALRATHGAFVSDGSTLGTWKLAVDNCSGNFDKSLRNFGSFSNSRERRILIFERPFSGSGWNVTLQSGDGRRDMVFPVDACRITGDWHKEKYGRGPSVVSGAMTVDCALSGQRLTGNVALRGCD